MVIGTRPITFTVNLAMAYELPVTMTYGTATASSDYQANSGTPTIPAGQAGGTIAVQAIGDRLAEPNETFTVNLNNSNYEALIVSQGLATIVDDEPRISISDVSHTEGKKNQATLFTFTATAGDQDYVVKTGMLTFAPGETSKTITIEVKGDSKKESNETFYVDLFGNSSNSQFIKTRGVGNDSERRLNFRAEDSR